jgi:adenylate cyclase
MNFQPLRQIKIKSLILSLFLLLITASSTGIIAFNYSKNTKSITEFSRGTIDRAADLIIAKVECLLQDTQQPTEQAIGFFNRHPDITLENKELISYLLEEVKYHQHLYSFYIGAPNGNALMALNLSFVDNLFNFSLQPNPPPPNAIYAVVLFDLAFSASREVWLYYDKNLNILLSEELPFRGYDPRTRPWYIGAVAAKQLYWTDIYHYFPSQDSGISVANPVFNQSNELIGVVAVDLSLSLFSKFLTDLSIGKNGRAFMLDSSGEVILPTNGFGKIPKTVLADAYRQFTLEKKENFQFKSGHVTYLASISSLPLSAGKNWQIAIIDPLSDYFSEIIKTQKEVVLLSLVILVLATLLVFSFSNYLSKPIIALSQEIDRITHLDLESTTRINSPIQEIHLMDSSIHAMRIALRSFAHYVPKEIAKQLMHKEHEILIGGEKKNVTIFFSDIVGFTSIAETLPLETVTSLLAEYFDVLSKIILQHQGSIDKYIGDSIMALWGAPEEITDHAAKACKTALFCQRWLSDFNENQRKKGLPELFTLMGLNTGSVIVGNFGTSERMNYTVIGDAVNTASRLQQLNKIYKTKIIIGEEVVRSIGEEFLIRPLDDLEVRGKKKKTKIYELVALKTGEPSLIATKEEIELCEEFTKAYESLLREEIEKARELFKAISEKFPNDIPTQIYLKRITGP